MSNVGYATLTIIPSAKGFQSALTKETSGPLSRQGAAGGKQFGGAFIGGVKPMVGALGGLFAAQKIGGFFTGAITEASDLGESVNALNVTYGDASEGIQELGRNAAQALGLSNVEFNGLAVQFGAFAKTISGPGGDVTGTLDEMTTRAADFASVMNLEVSEAAAMFQSGLAGQSEPLRKFGIDMSAASVEAYAYANGIAESGEKLTEAQKVQARYGFLMEQTAATQGDFANTSDSLANVQRRLSSSWKDLQAKLGAGFLPILEKTLGFLNSTALPGLEAFGGGIRSVWRILSEGDFDGNLFGFAEDSSQVDFLFDMRDRIVEGLNGIRDFIAGFTLPAPDLTALTNSGVELDGLVAIGARAREIFDQLVATFAPLVTSFGALFTSVSPVSTVFQALQPLLPQLLEVFTRLGSVLGATLLTAIQTLVPIFVQLQGVVVSVLSDTLAAILPVIVQLITQVASTFTQLLPVILPVIATIARLAATLISQLAPIVVNLVTSVLPPVITAFGQLIAAVAPFIAQLITRLIPVIQDLMPVVQTVFGFLADFVGAAMQIVQGIIQTVTGIISGDWSMVWTGIQNVFSGVWDAIKALVGAAIAIVSEIIDSTLATISSIWSGAWDGITSFVSDAWDNITSAISTGIDESVTWLSELPGRAVTALGDIGSTLLSSGASLIQGFIDGITSIDIGGAIEGVLGTIRDFFPFSPAKRGPFSGRGYTSYSGRALATDFAKGIEDETRAVERAALGVTEAAELVPRVPSFGSPDVGANRLDRSADGPLSPIVGSLTLQSTGDTREDLDEALFHLRRLSRGGAHAR